MSRLALCCRDGPSLRHVFHQGQRACVLAQLPQLPERLHHCRKLPSVPRPPGGSKRAIKRRLQFRRATQQRGTDAQCLPRMVPAMLSAVASVAVCISPR